MMAGSIPTAVSVVADELPGGVAEESDPDGVSVAIGRGNHSKDEEKK